jgi:protein O-mannosyl-transferase
LAENSSPWRALRLSARAPLLLALLTVLPYANSFSGGFTLDSKQAILLDERVHDVSARNLGLILDHTYWWPYDQSGLYRPLTTLSYLFNYAVLGNGAAPFGYHAFNLLLHLANVLLVYAIARRFTPYAWAAAAVWAVHPVLTESVINIVGRADLLAAFGMLSAIWLYVTDPTLARSTDPTSTRSSDRSRGRKGAVRRPVDPAPLRSRLGWRSGGSGGGQWLRYFGIFAATALAVFSKESAVVLPALLPLFDHDRRRLLRGLAATAIPIAAFLAQRATVLSTAMPRSVPFTDNPLVAADFITAKLAALSVLGRYVWLLVWPARLSADYSWSQIPVAANWAALATLVLAVALAIRWNWRAAAFAAVVLLPVSNLLFPTGTIMAERFLYLPAIVLALAIAQLCRRRAGLAAVAILVVAFAARTWARNRDWHDDLAMAQSIVHAAPASYKGHRLLAWELFQSHGDTARILDEAAKSVAPLQDLPDLDNSPETWRLAGGYYAAGEQYARSAELLERCLRIVHAQKARNPGASYAGMGQALDVLADDYRALGRRDDAAITLMVGQLATGDQTFRNRLLDLYRGVECALMAGPNGPAINPQCPVVHEHLCAAIARAGTSAESAAYGCKK